MSDHILMSTAEVTDLEPASSSELGLKSVEGDPSFGIHTVLETDALVVGVATAQPSAFDYEFHTDTIVHLVEGRAKVTVDGADLEFREGNIAVFPKGTRSHWRIESALREVFVESGVRD